MAKMIIVEADKVNAAMEKYEKLLAAEPILREQRWEMERLAAQEKERRDREHRQRFVAPPPPLTKGPNENKEEKHGEVPGTHSTSSKEPPDHEVSSGKGE